MRKNFYPKGYKGRRGSAVRAEHGSGLGVMMIPIAIAAGLTILSATMPDAETAEFDTVYYAYQYNAVNARIEEPVMTREETTTVETSETEGTTTSTTSTTEVTVTESSTSTTSAATTIVTTTTTEVYTTTESVVETEVEYNSGVGQYGRAINPDEYVFLAEVIEHEGGYCPLYVQEHIGICLLNRVFVPGFADSIYGCKEQRNQYFSGYYPFSEASAELAKSMIAAYNSGGEYWARYCEERGLNCRTKFQRNDYCVPNTTYVNDDYDCTSGGFQFHMYYSE